MDLNPIRSGIAPSIEASEFTSVVERLIDFEWDRDASTKAPKIRTNSLEQKRKAPQTPSPKTPRSKKPLKLQAFLSPSRNFHPSDFHQSPQLPIPFTDYLQLIDMGSRMIRLGKNGFIDEKTPPILNRLSLKPAG